MAIDLTKTFKKYKGLWVAFKEDNETVVASGKTVKEVIRNAEKKGFKKSVLFHVPIKILPYIGHC